MTTSSLIGYKTVSDVVSKLAFFLTVVLAARVLSPHDFGIFALATTAGWILSVLSDFGLQLHVAREVASERSETSHASGSLQPAPGVGPRRSEESGTPRAVKDVATRPDRRQSIVWPIFRVRLALAAIAWLGVTPVVFAYLPRADAAVFQTLVLAQLVASLVEFLNYVHRGLSRSDRESSLNLGHRLIVLAMAAALLPALPRLGTVAGVLLLPAVATLAASAILVSRVGSNQHGTGERLELGSLIRAVWPIGIGIVLSALYFRLDLLLVGYWNGTQGAALYNAVFRLVEALRLFPAAVLAVTFPALCGARDLRPLLRVSAGLGALALALLGAGYVAAGWVVALFYGERYLEAVPAFRILLLAVPLLFVNYALTHQLIGWNAQRRYAALCAGALAVNVALNSLLIPRYGINGAAWTTLLTELFLTAGCLLALGAVAHTRGARPVFSHERGAPPPRAQAAS